VAQWRPLNKRITSSDKAYQLADDPGALWLYCALLPHTDKEGRVNANPHHILGGILEGWPYTPDQIERWLLELARVGLIELYRNGRRSHIAQFTKFQEMAKPDKREPASDLPGPTDEGSQSMLPEPPRHPARDSSRNLPEESAKNPREPQEGSQEEPGEGDAETPRTHVHVHVHEQVHEQPPQPPHEPAATSSEEGEEEDPDPQKTVEPQDDLTHYQRRRRDRPPDPLPASRLATLHPEAWAALTDFRRAIGDVTEGQFTAWAKTVAEHVDEHGEAAVADALRRTLEKTRLKHPFAYYRKVIGQPKSPTGDAADAEYREVTAAEFLEGRWN